MAVETTPQDHGDESGVSDMMSEGSPPPELILSRSLIEGASQPLTPLTSDPLEKPHHYIKGEQQGMGD